VEASGIKKEGERDDEEEEEEEDCLLGRGSTQFGR
jgi:hypothetical protein